MVSTSAKCPRNCGRVEGRTYTYPSWRDIMLPSTCFRLPYPHEYGWGAAVLKTWSCIPRRARGAASSRRVRRIPIDPPDAEFVLFRVVCGPAEDENRMEVEGPVAHVCVQLLVSCNVWRVPAQRRVA